MSLCWNLAPAREYCLQFADEATEGTRKQLAQGQVGLEPQICLTPDPGDRAESHLSSVTQHLLQEASERSFSTQVTDSCHLLELAPGMSGWLSWLSLDLWLWS